MKFNIQLEADLIINGNIFWNIYRDLQLPFSNEYMLADRLKYLTTSKVEYFKQISRFPINIDHNQYLRNVLLFIEKSGVIKTANYVIENLHLYNYYVFGTKYEELEQLIINLLKSQKKKEQIDLLKKFDWSVDLLNALTHAALKIHDVNSKVIMKGCQPSNMITPKATFGQIENYIKTTKIKQGYVFSKCNNWFLIYYSGDELCFPSGSTLQHYTGGPHFHFISSKCINKNISQITEIFLKAPKMPSTEHVVLSRITNLLIPFRYEIDSYVIEITG